MEQRRKQKNKQGNLFILLVVLFICVELTLAIIFGSVSNFSQTKFKNVMPLTESGAVENVPMITYTDRIHRNNPQFVMEAEADIFKFFYDETGSVTVIGDENNTDKLIAPGTDNLFQFTLRNPGDVALDYRMEVEAYVTGFEEYLPVNARMWDYKNKYLLGSSEEMKHVLELDGIKDSGELAAGRNAVYNIEWQWPFEWGDDEHDTMLGNMAVDEDLRLHIVIRTYAEYDEEPEDPNAGIPQTGDDSKVALLVLLCVVSFVGICGMFIAFIKAGRKEKQAE